MTDKKFLVPVVALIAFGLPAVANVTVYCDSSCGSNDTAAFSSALGVNGYTYANGTDITFTGLLSNGGLQYNDGLTSVLFSSTNMFAITNSTLVATVNTAMTIQVPAAYAAVQLYLSQSGGGTDFTCLDTACDGTNLTSALTEVDYLNNTPGSGWTISISTVNPSEQLVINSFDPAGTMTQSDTPEVGTLLLIGVGLLAMRWMRRLQPRPFRRLQTAC